MHHGRTAKPPPSPTNSCLNGQISNNKLIPTDLVGAGLKDINLNRLILKDAIKMFKSVKSDKPVKRLRVIYGFRKRSY